MLDRIETNRTGSDSTSVQAANFNDSNQSLFIERDMHSKVVPVAPGIVPSATIVDDVIKFHREPPDLPPTYLFQCAKAEAVVKEVFKLCDADKDNVITPGELKAASSRNDLSDSDRKALALLERAFNENRISQVTRSQLLDYVNCFEIRKENPPARAPRQEIMYF